MFRRMIIGAAVLWSNLAGSMLCAIEEQSRLQEVATTAMECTKEAVQLVWNATKLLSTHAYYGACSAYRFGKPYVIVGCKKSYEGACNAYEFAKPYVIAGCSATCNGLFETYEFSKPYVASGCYWLMSKVGLGNENNDCAQVSSDQDQRDYVHEDPRSRASVVYYEPRVSADVLVEPSAPPADDLVASEPVPVIEGSQASEVVEEEVVGSPSVIADEVEDELECIICFESEPDIILYPYCQNHAFCLGCMKEILERDRGATCPLCRGMLDQDIIKDLHNS